MTITNTNLSASNSEGSDPRGERLRLGLSQCPLCAGLPAEALDDLARRLSLRIGAPGTELVAQDEPGAGLFIVLSGRAKVALLGDNGREVTLHVLRPGDVFGEVSLLDGSPSSTTVSVSSQGDAVVAFIGRESFDEHVQGWPRTARNLLGEMARRLRRADEAIAGLALHDVEERLRRLLTRLAREEGDVTAEGLLLRRRPTQQELANMVGSSRETVSRTFTSLIQRGLMVPRGRALIITQRMLNRAGAAARGPLPVAPTQNAA